MLNLEEDTEIDRFSTSLGWLSLMLMSPSNSWINGYNDLTYLGCDKPAFPEGKIFIQQPVPGTIPRIFVGCPRRNNQEFVEQELE